MAIIAACSDSSNDTPPPAGQDAGTVDAGSGDSAVPVSLGGFCVQDTDCASGLCVSGTCTKPCGSNADCPAVAPWACTNRVCSCTKSGVEVCDGKDNDCDGTADNGSSLCAAGQSCNAGQCVCPPQNTCPSGCFDLQNDKNHCGTCNKTCDVDCGSGKCRTVADIAAGQQHACARMSDGAVKCWGWNDYGQLGQDTQDDCATRKCGLLPREVPGVAGVAEIAVGPAHSCARLTGGGVMCWGDDDVGELGFTSTVLCGPRTCSGPKAVPGIATATQITLGGGHTCALVSDGTVKCWGANDFGQLGYTTLEKCDLISCSHTPQQVVGVTDVVQIVSGGQHTCARTRGGQVYCWGANQYGQIGAPTVSTCAGEKCSTVPVLVAGLSNVASLAAGTTHTCARMTDGTVSCWGANQYGQLGASSSETCTGVACATAPIAVPGMTEVADVALGSGHTCARKSDGTAWCWGSNDSGALGYDTTSTCSGFPCSPTPTQVPSVSDVGDISLGFSHTCVSQKAGSALCWGYNYFGQLGDGTRSSRTTPKSVAW